MHSNFVLHLPNEIPAIIINELAFDIDKDSDKDKILAALASCRLASHVLCSLATPLFFSSISLTDRYDNGSYGYSLFVRRATKLNDILATRNIAASIHTLTLYCAEQTLRDFSSSAIMSAILPRLPHIQKFSLGTRSFVYFPTLPMDFAAAIQGLCRSPNLTTLSLDGIRHFPFRTIRTSPNLRCLHLWGAGDLAVKLIFFPSFLRQLTLSFQFDNINSRDEISSSHLLHLESLELDREVINTLGSRISKDVSIAKCFSRLKNLQLNDLFTNHASLSHGWDVMLLSLQTLKKLELTGGFFTGRFHPGCALRLLLTHDKFNQKTSWLVSLLIWVGSQPCDISKLNSTVRIRIIRPLFVSSPPYSLFHPLRVALKSWKLELPG